MKLYPTSQQSSRKDVDCLGEGGVMCTRWTTRWIGMNFVDPALGLVSSVDMHRRRHATAADFQRLRSIIRHSTLRPCGPGWVVVLLRITHFRIGWSENTVAIPRLGRQSSRHLSCFIEAVRDWLDVHLLLAISSRRCRSVPSMADQPCYASLVV